jgi:precorrin-6Y C5,15-methyltransferase (decarboxylating)
VIAVEADPAQCDRIRQNAGRHQVRLRIVHGKAPEVLTGLPPADAVFAGGGDHAVLQAAIRHANPRTTVVTLAAVERVGETAMLLTAEGYQAGGVQLQASRLTSLPGQYHRLAAQNPVFVLWGQR